MKKGAWTRKRLIAGFHNFHHVVKLPALAHLPSSTMPQLFDVPGWTVPNPPASSSKADKGNKKRKRPGSVDSGSMLLKSAEHNFDKIMDKLKETTKPRQEKDKKASEKVEKKKKNKNETKSKEPEQPSRPQPKPEISQPKPLQAKSKSKNASRESVDSSARPAKRVKTKHAAEDPSQNAKKKVAAVAQVATDEHLTPMQKSMKQSLDGAKFRCVGILQHEASYPLNVWYPE